MSSPYIPSDPDSEPVQGEYETQYTDYQHEPGGYAEYQQTYIQQPQPFTPPQSNNTSAIISFALSLGGIFVFGLNIAAVVMGIIALNQIKKTPQEGRGFAIAGIVIGGASLVLYILAAGIFLLFLFVGVTAEMGGIV